MIDFYALILCLSSIDKGGLCNSTYGYVEDGKVKNTVFAKSSPNQKEEETDNPHKDTPK